MSTRTNYFHVSSLPAVRMGNLKLRPWLQSLLGAVSSLGASASPHRGCLLQHGAGWLLSAEPDPYLLLCRVGACQQDAAGPANGLQEATQLESRLGHVEGAHFSTGKGVGMIAVSLVLSPCCDEPGLWVGAAPEVVPTRG